MAKWKYAYPVIQENVSADIMGWPAVPDYETVFGKLKEMGYEGIELQARDFSAVDAGRLRGALEKYGLQGLPELKDNPEKLVAFYKDVEGV